MRVLVCGGRDYNNWNRVCEVLNSLQIDVLIEGGARGADAHAQHWAQLNNIPVETYQADWKLWGKGAGHMRNRKMLKDGRPNLVVAFPGGRGTADMVERAKKAGVPVQEIDKEMPLFEGYIRNTKTNQGKSRNGRAWTSYNAEIHTEKGVQKISFGFDKPSVQEGDYVKLEADVVNGFMQVDQSTVQRIDAPKQEAVVPASTISTDVQMGVDTFGKFNRQTHPEDAQRMTYAAARTAALEMVSVLLQNNALPVSAASNKAGSAKRFDEIAAAVDKLTVKFYHDGLSLRILDTVADTEPSTAPKSDLPSEEPETKESNPIDD